MAMRSPTLSRSAPGPSALTTPDASCPSTRGPSTARSPMRPSVNQWTSEPHTPTALTSTSTCPGPGTGTGRSSSSIRPGRTITDTGAVAIGPTVVPWPTNVPRDGTATLDTRALAVVGRAVLDRTRRGADQGSGAAHGRCRRRRAGGDLGSGTPLRGDGARAGRGRCRTGRPLPTPRHGPHRAPSALAPCGTAPSGRPPPPAGAGRGGGPATLRRGSGRRSGARRAREGGPTVFARRWAVLAALVAWWSSSWWWSSRPSPRSVLAGRTVQRRLGGPGPGQQSMQSFASADEGVLSPQSRCYFSLPTTAGHDVAPYLRCGPVLVPWSSPSGPGSLTGFRRRAHQFGGRAGGGARPLARHPWRCTRPRCCAVRTVWPRLRCRRPGRAGRPSPAGRLGRGPEQPAP